MPTRSLSRYIKRYTTLSSALDTLVRKKLVLLSPTKWDDTNDVYLMELYAKQASVDGVLALCATMATETYHHWKVFTAGMEGICIEIDRQALEQAISRLNNIEARAVEYLKVRELEAFTAGDIGRLPFTKREGYSDEREWRIVATASNPMQFSIDIDIDVSWINRIVVNPWQPTVLVKNLRQIIQRIDGCNQISIVSSALTNSARWKAAGKAICS